MYHVSALFIFCLGERTYKKCKNSNMRMHPLRFHISIIGLNGIMVVKLRIIYFDSIFDVGLQHY